MLFNSPEFIFLFLPSVVLGYFLINRLRLVLLSKLWLVAGSLFFYSWWNPIYLPLLVGSILVNFLLVKVLHRTAVRKSGHADGWSRKSIVTLGIAFNLGLLGYFKYADFFVRNANWVLGVDFQPLDLALPLAISFFTFQQITYLVDSYKLDTAEHDFLNYCLFVTFFPQLIVGPIVHHAEMMPQFKRLRSGFANWNNVATGMFVFTLGLFKKVVIADTFDVWADAGFDAERALSFFEAWGASLSYTFQIYYDFSAYSDMAMGAALLFNIRLPVNFNSPLKSLNFQEFWRRWHITLSRFLRDYVYIPLGGSREGRYRAYLAIMITFVVSGLWHGAAWTFVIFGAVHGLALVVFRLWRRTGTAMPALLAWCITFFTWNFSLVLFRSESFGRTVDIFKGMFGMYGFEISTGVAAAVERFLGIQVTGLAVAEKTMLVPLHMVWFTLVFAAVALFLPNVLQVARLLPYEGSLQFRADWKQAIATGLVFFIAVMTFVGQTEPSEFQYFAF